MAKVRVIKYQAVYEAINELEEYIEHASQVLRYAKIIQIEEGKQ